MSVIQLSVVAPSSLMDPLLQILYGVSNIAVL